MPWAKRSVFPHVPTGNARMPNGAQIIDDLTTLECSKVSGYELQRRIMSLFLF